MPNVLVLCHGNINRSALCGAVLRGYYGLSVLTAGFVNPGRRASKKMRDAAAFHSIDLEGHRSTLASVGLLNGADYVIYMDGGNLKRLIELNGSPDPRFGQSWLCLGKFAEPKRDRIPDPAFIARDTQEFTDVVQLILQASHNLARDILSKVDVKTKNIYQTEKDWS